MGNYNNSVILKEGDKLEVPKGFRVEFKDGRVSVYGPNTTAESRRGFGFGDFLYACKKKGYIE